MLLEELDEVFSRDSPVLRTGNAISLESAGVEPFAHGPRGHLTDLCDLSCGEHLHMQDLRFPYVILELAGLRNTETRPAMYAPAC